ncbi:hypothetical protein PHLCEN_2v4058 [Hermanssonia centrifuga]|uniref:DH domain-containing protein n=1 Tax=Hermanssonia centrifuga TaxID=98765 RepID=A0A2R6Q5F3_9APHY|nr:hypothetical protein PHLCEN_2v4058 [Hermanssonia centrifuga]
MAALAVQPPSLDAQPMPHTVGWFQLDLNLSADVEVRPLQNSVDHKLSTPVDVPNIHPQPPNVPEQTPDDHSDQPAHCFPLSCHPSTTTAATTVHAPLPHSVTALSLSPPSTLPAPQQQHVVDSGWETDIQPGEGTSTSPHQVLQTNSGGSARALLPFIGPLTFVLGFTLSYRISHSLVSLTGATTTLPYIKPESRLNSPWPTANGAKPRDCSLEVPVNVNSEQGLQDDQEACSDTEESSEFTPDTYTDEQTQEELAELEDNLPPLVPPKPYTFPRTARGHIRVPRYGYAMSDPGHGTASGPSSSMAKTFPGYTTSHVPPKAFSIRARPHQTSGQPRASWAYAYTPMESILNLDGPGPSQLYTHAQSIHRNTQFYGSGSGGVDFSQDSLFPSTTHLGSMSHSTLQFGSTANSTTLSLSPSQITLASTMQRGQTRNKLRKLPPNSPYRMARQRTNSISSLNRARTRDRKNSGAKSMAQLPPPSFVIDQHASIDPSLNLIQAAERSSMAISIGSSAYASSRPLSDTSFDLSTLDRASTVTDSENARRSRRVSVTFDELSLIGPGAMRSMSDDGHVYASTSQSVRPPISPKAHVSRSGSGSGTSSSSSSGSTSGWTSMTNSTTPTSPGVSEAHTSSSSASPLTPSSAASHSQPQVQNPAHQSYFTIKEQALHGNVEEEGGFFGGSGVDSERHGEMNDDVKSMAHHTRNAKSESTLRLKTTPSKVSLSPSTRPTSPRKLVKKRPGSTVLPSEKTSHTPVTETNSAPATVGRSKSILGVKFGSGGKDVKGKGPFTRGGMLGAFKEDEPEDDYHRGCLPPIRSPSPIWAGTIFSPYTRTLDSRPNIPGPQLDNTTDALTSIAFTGNTHLSSSALAALTSRLTHHASQTKASEGDAKGTAQASGWVAPFDVSPFAEKDEHEAFDPYAELVGMKKAKDEEEKNQGTWTKASFARKAKELGRRSSISFLRIDTSKKEDPPAPLPTRPPMPRRRSKTLTKTSSREEERKSLSLRRWTLAMADVPDEVLVQELERFRLEGRGARKRKRAGLSLHGHAEGEKDEKAFVYGGPDMNGSESSRERKFQVGTGENGEPEDDGEDDDELFEDARSNVDQSELGSLERHPTTLQDDAGWKSARRALLCCRELVRTERNYQTRLRQLIVGDTTCPPSPFILTYVPALLGASEALLARLEDDPSAWGVSAAFVGVEEELEAAFVAWCGVIGEIFVGEEFGDGEENAERTGRKAVKSWRTGEEGSWSLSKRSRSGVSLSNSHGHGGVESVYRKRAASYAEESPANTANGLGMFTAALGTGLAYGISPHPSSHQADEFGMNTSSRATPHIRTSSSGPLSLSRTFSVWKRMSTSLSSSTSLLQSSPSSPTVSNFSPFLKEKKPSVRELAIQPTQRVMRYVLQYRDLLDNTPVESPSRGLVERALESAMRIAEKCDRAQDNSAFLRRT